MVNIECPYSCSHNKDGKCNADDIKMTEGNWNGDSCPVCATGFFGDYWEETKAPKFNLGEK